MSPRSNRILYSLACLPLASAAVSHEAIAVAPLQHADVAWTFAHENVLGTSLDITLRASDARTAELAEAALLSSIDRDNFSLSSWNPNSEFSRWLKTRNVATHVSPELLQVLSLFDQWREQTNGAIQPAAEAAIHLWRSTASEGRQPTSSELRAAVATMQQIHWRLDPSNQQVTRLTETPLVLASLTKSYIADRAAEAALRAGAQGLVLNLGGDIVVRGDIAQTIDIANPLADAENAPALDRIVLRNRTIATSGSYRRAFNITNANGRTPERSHILDPRTATPANAILSSSVIAKDPTTAGALATAFSILTPSESRSLAAKHDADYLLVTREGRQLTSAGWSGYRAELRPASSSTAAPQRPSAAAAASPWAEGFALDINLELARIGDFRYRRPYIAVWIENEQHVPVREIALWYQKERYLEELRVWSRTTRLAGRAALNAASSISSATRSPGTYTLKWDGKDDAGKLLAPGKYTVCIEAVREHGGYQIIRQEIDFGLKPQQMSLPAGAELGGVTLDYHKR